MRTIPREVQDFARIKDSFKLSEKQKSVLLGTLLGDGSLKRRGNYYRLHIKHSYKQISLVRYKREMFSNITSMPIRVFFQKVKDKDYKFCEFVTLTHPEFSKYRKLFYRDKKKVILQKLKQQFNNSLSLAMWFITDFKNTANFQFADELKLICHPLIRRMSWTTAVQSMPAFRSIRNVLA